MNERVDIKYWFAGLLLVVLLPAFSLSAQEIRVNAPDEVLEHEVFEVQYEIISEDPLEEAPTLLGGKDFEMVAEPQFRKSSPSPFWGDRYYTLRVLCRFKPKKSGKFDLPRIELISDGHKMTSPKRKLQVRELPDMGDVKCFVKASITKSSLTIGDTLTATYKLYTTHEVASIVRLEVPGLRSFNYQDLSPRRATFVEEKVDGVVYKVYEIRRYLLQATSLGSKTLGVGVMEVEYTYPTGRVRMDSWGRKYEEQLRETKECPIEEITIRVHDMIAI